MDGLPNTINKTLETACIMVHTKKILEIQKNWGDYSPIHCVSYFRCSGCNKWSYTGKCIAYCGHWHLLQLTEEEKSDFRNSPNKASINLVDHFAELIPSVRRGSEKPIIGLVTFQNGINNNYGYDFSEMGKEIVKNLKEERPLCIGLYNQTATIGIDLCRLQAEFLGIQTEIVRNNIKMFKTLTNSLANNTPHPYWLHIAHSEGGLIARETICRLRDDPLIYCLNHLLVHTYGSVAPIAKRTVFGVINTYSEYDIAYKNYGKFFERRHDYDIKVTEPLEAPFLPIPGDHAFLGATYRKALQTNIDETRDHYDFFNSRNSSLFYSYSCGIQ